VELVGELADGGEGVVGEGFLAGGQGEGVGERHSGRWMARVQELGLRCGGDVEWEMGGCAKSSSAWD